MWREGGVWEVMEGVVCVECVYMCVLGVCIHVCVGVCIHVCVGVYMCGVCVHVCVGGCIHVCVGVFL